MEVPIIASGGADRPVLLKPPGGAPDPGGCWLGEMGEMVEDICIWVWINHYFIITIILRSLLWMG